MLGSINLSEFIVNPFTTTARIDYDSLENTVCLAVKALNDVLLEGMDLHPLKEQRDSVYDWRQIGLGTMGLADMLIKLNLPYGSHDSIMIIAFVYKLIAQTAVETSLELAKTYGCFPQCSDKLKEHIANSDFIKALDLPSDIIADIRKYGLFNSQLLTCAPTGTISTMFQTSGGVEPNFAFSFNRRTVSLNSEETIYKVDAKIVSDFKKVSNLNTLPYWFIASHEVNPKSRINVQATLQTYIDASISSTINLKEETTIDDVFDLYVYAWEKGLKGITIWRDNCNRQAILSTDTPKEEPSKPIIQEVSDFTPITKVSDNCVGKKRTLITGCGTLHLLAYFDKTTGKLLETYFNKGSKGGCALFASGLSRMVSLAARGNISIDNIVDQLLSAGTCPSYAVRTATKKDTSKGSCCPTAIGYALRDMYNEMQSEIKGNQYPIIISEYGKDPIIVHPDSSGIKCPKCGESMYMTEGCQTCPSCGYSKCS